MFMFFALLLLALSLAADVMAINYFIKVGMAKGYSMENRGALWFIGLVAVLGPIVIGLYVAALPDRSGAPSEGADLPSLDTPVPVRAAAPAHAAPAHAAPKSSGSSEAPVPSAASGASSSGLDLPSL